MRNRGPLNPNDYVVVMTFLLSYAGRALLSVNADSVSRVPGIVRVIRQRNSLAVVAQTESGAISAAQQLKAIWSDWQGLPDEDTLWDYVRATKITKDDVTSNRGDVDAALAAADKKLSATYDFAIHTHGSIGPSCAVASFEGGKLTCWSASQATHNLRQQLALMFGMPDADVRAIYIDGSGCYGRNGHEDAAADAAAVVDPSARPHAKCFRQRGIPRRDRRRHERRPL
jgi:nicotinate dehydrogenase subunit B